VPGGGKTRWGLQSVEVKDKSHQSEEDESTWGGSEILFVHMEPSPVPVSVICGIPDIPGAPSKLSFGLVHE